MEKVEDWGYEEMQMIGAGGFSKVHLCRHKITGKNVAIKVVSVRSEREGVDGYTVREVSFLKGMDHPNIVKLLDVKSSGKFVYLFFEHLDTDLDKLLNDSPRTFMDPVLVKNFLQQILSSVEYCHSYKILHRDIKPGNFLIDMDKRIVKLADFGMARSVEVPTPGYSNEVVTPRYSAPELLLGTFVYSTSVDIWSVGCIFGEMVKQKPLFSSKNIEGNSQFSSTTRNLNVIFSLLGSPTEETWPGLTSKYKFLDWLPKHKPKILAEEFTGLQSEGVDLLSKMLRLDPTKRITARDALEHPYFQSV